MKNSFYYISLLFITLSCKENNDQRLENSNKKISKNMILDKKNQCLDKQKDFLAWYLDNYVVLDSTRSIIKYPKELLQDSYDSTYHFSTNSYYQFDSINLDKYLQRIKDTGYFSNQFIESKRVSMMARGKVLDELKQEDGPAEGFNFDEIFHTQEMYLSSNIATLKVDPKNSNNYILPIMEGFSWIIYTKKVGNTCLIDSIGNN